MGRSKKKPAATRTPEGADELEPSEFSRRAENSAAFKVVIPVVGVLGVLVGILGTFVTMKQCSDAQRAAGSDHAPVTNQWIHTDGLEEACILVSKDTHPLRDVTMSFDIWAMDIDAKRVLVMADQKMAQPNARQATLAYGEVFKTPVPETVKNLVCEEPTPWEEARYACSQTGHDCATVLECRSVFHRAADGARFRERSFALVRRTAGECTFSFFWPMKDTSDAGRRQQAILDLINKNPQPPLESTFFDRPAQPVE